MLNRVIEDHKIVQTSKMIDKAEKIVILCHEHPDGDAIGSSLGLYHLLRVLDKEVSVVVYDPFPSFLSWLKGADDVIVYQQASEKAVNTIEEADLIFCLDFNQHERVGGGLEEPLMRSSANRIMVDHHPDPERFCDVMISHPELSSTGEMIFRLICRMGYFEEINSACAEAIFTAITLDTGNFAHNADSPYLYDIVAELIRHGVKKSEVYERLFQNTSPHRLKLWGYALYHNMHLDVQRNMAYMTLTNEELTQFHNEKGLTEGIVNELLNIKGVYYAVFLREEQTGVVNLSFRSLGDRPVNEYAKRYFTGGGHLNAAGGRFKGSMKEAVALLESTFVLDDEGRLEINNYKEAK